jgi:hypothetical protein
MESSEPAEKLQLAQKIPTLNGRRYGETRGGQRRGEEGAKRHANPTPFHEIIMHKMGENSKKTWPDDADQTYGNGAGKDRS